MAKPPRNPADSLAQAPPQYWNGVARFLHWTMALLIAAQATLGWIGHDMVRSQAKLELMTAHKSLGITLLLLVLLRLLWRATHAAPPHPAGAPRWELLAARLSHAALYLLLIAIPLSGWLAASTSLVPWKLWWVIPWPDIAPVNEQLHEVAEELHEVLVNVLIAVLVVHVGAALQHHFFRHNDVLLRMLRGAK